MFSRGFWGDDRFRSMTCRHGGIQGEINLNLIGSSMNGLTSYNMFFYFARTNTAPQSCAHQKAPEWISPVARFSTMFPLATWKTTIHCPDDCHSLSSPYANLHQHFPRAIRFAGYCFNPDVRENIFGLWFRVGGFAFAPDQRQCQRHDTEPPMLGSRIRTRIENF